MLLVERKDVRVGRMRERASCRLSCKASSSLATSRSSTGRSDWERESRREGLVPGNRAANTSRATLSDRALPFWGERERDGRDTTGECTTDFLELMEEILLEARKVGGLQLLRFSQSQGKLKQSVLLTFTSLWRFSCPASRMALS